MNPKIDFVVSGILQQDNKVLMIWHNKLNAWLFPGGHVEYGETLEEAVTREFYEETGIKVSVIPRKNGQLAAENVTEENLPFCILKEPIPVPGDFHYHLDFIFPVCTEESLALTLKEGLKWVSPGDADLLETPENVKNILNQAGKLPTKKS